MVMNEEQLSVSPSQTSSEPKHAYSIDEVVANFVALLNDADFSKELRMLKIGTFNPLLKRSMLTEMKGIYTALWALALQRSFPETAECIFDNFVDQYCQNMSSRAHKQLHDKMYAYKDMILLHGDQDFSHISWHLLSFSKVPQDEMKAEVLRLSLHLRQHYTFLFERLV